MAVINLLFEREGTSLWLIIFVTSLAIFLYPISTIIYNIYFHPLSHLPGPKPWVASRIPYIISLLRGNLVKDQVAIHEKYGDIVRIAPGEISFAKEEAWSEIYTQRLGHTAPSKDPVWYKAPDEMPQNIVTTLDPATHSKFRRLLSSSFTDTALRNQAPVIESYADLLIQQLSHISGVAQDGAIINIVDWTSWFTVDLIGELALGESFNCLQNKDFHPWVKTLHGFLNAMVYAATTRWYPSIEFIIMKLLPKSIMEVQRKHTEFANEKLNRRLNLEKEKEDFITPFMKDNVGFTKVSLKETQSNLSILIPAGADATATVLSGTICYLVQNPDTLQKLAREIRDTFEREDEVNIASIRDLPYLNAVIHEGLRLTNPVPGGLPRIVPKGGDIYAGVFLPEGTSISIRPYVLSHSTTYFSSPYTFAPERWLQPGIRPAEFDNDKLSASQPFSVGHLNCIGKKLAWAELRIVLARLVWRFELEEAGERVDWARLKMGMLVQKEKVMVRIKGRHGA